MGNFWAWIWTLIFLGVAGFLCFAGEVGRSAPSPLKLGTLLIKTYFFLPQIFKCVMRIHGSNNWTPCHFSLSGTVGTLMTLSVGRLCFYQIRLIWEAT